jgi:OFA family oxalate/formate antiporter-like MFS transporter
MDKDLQSFFRSRWIIIFLAMGVMMIISIYQYSWSLFAYGIRKDLGWDLAILGMAFTIFNIATFTQPFAGIIADLKGPRGVALLGALLVGFGFILASVVTLPWHLYLFYGIGGTGVGFLYGVSAASAVKWFPDRRGLATGLVVFGFGAGTAIFNWIIQEWIATHGFRSTFVYVGIGMLVFLVPASFFYKYPPANWNSAFEGGGKINAQPAVDYRPPEMFGTIQWYLVYFAFSFTISIVLMFAAQIKMMAKEFNLPAGYFTLLLVLFPLGNGFSRMLGGAVSDKIGREKTMSIFYTLLGFSIIALVLLGKNHLFFVIFVVIASLLGGSPFAIYPALIGDYYGPKYATTNYGITYTAKAWAGLISGWASGYFVAQTGSYEIPLIVVAACSLAAAFLSSPWILKPPKQGPKGG